MKTKTFKTFEAAYESGARRAHLIHFTEALRGLDRDGPEWTQKSWVAEREDAILTLRRICAQHGDNDWPDDLHLSDIIQKNLECYLP